MNLHQAWEICPGFQYTHVKTFEVEEESEENKNTKELTNKFYYKDDLDVNNPRIRDKYKEKVTLVLYWEESKKIQDIICEEARTVEKGSIDEVYIDLTEEVLEELNQIQDPSKVFYSYDWRSVFAHSDQTEREPQGVEEQLIYLAAHRTYRIRKRIYDELGYKSSAGISYNKMLSKLGSQLNKPNRQTVILVSQIPALMENARIKKTRWDLSQK